MQRAAGLVVLWAPQAGVLHHASAGALVTHTGWASVVEGVSSGVPMVCPPILRRPEDERAVGVPRLGIRDGVSQGDDARRVWLRQWCCSSSA